MNLLRACRQVEAYWRFMPLDEAIRQVMDNARVSASDTLSCSGSGATFCGDGATVARQPHKLKIRGFDSLPRKVSGAAAYRPRAKEGSRGHASPADLGPTVANIGPAGKPVPRAPNKVTKGGEKGPRPEKQGRVLADLQLEAHGGSNEGEPECPRAERGVSRGRKEELGYRSDQGGHQAHARPSGCRDSKRGPGDPRIPLGHNAGRRQLRKAALRSADFYISTSLYKRPTRFERV